MRTLLIFALLTLCSCLFAQTNPDASPSTQIADFSVWSQRMDLSQYIGKKYRLTVAIRVETNSPESFAVAFIRNEPPAGGKLAWTYMDNMMDRPVRDSNWNTYTLEYRVDKKAPWIGFGILAYSNGVFYYDDLQLAVETAKGQWTPVPVPNGGFEQEALGPWEQSQQGVPARVLGAAAGIDSERPYAGKQCLKVVNTFLH